MEQKEINQLSQTLRKLVKIGKKEFFSIPYKNEHATYALAVLLFDNKHQGANLFLNKDDFMTTVVSESIPITICQKNKKTVTVCKYISY